jgi:uncharacterized damage-inducible protein DinB
MNRTVLVAFMACAALWGQTPSKDPLSEETRGFYNAIKNIVIRAAEQMPEADYAFRPTPEVRTFGELIGHVADWQYAVCGPVRGETKPMVVEKEKHTKSELVAALKEAFAYCDGAYSGLTDASAASTVQFLNRPRTRLITLNFNIYHVNEHYGNIVTYMRLKGLVPPSSQPR